MLTGAAGAPGLHARLQTPSCSTKCRTLPRSQPATGRHRAPMRMYGKRPCRDPARGTMWTAGLRRAERKSRGITSCLHGNLPTDQRDDGQQSMGCAPPMLTAGPKSSEHVCMHTAPWTESSHGAPACAPAPALLLRGPAPWRQQMSGRAWGACDPWCTGLGRPNQRRCTAEAGNPWAGMGRAPRGVRVFWV